MTSALQALRKKTGAAILVAAYLAWVLACFGMEYVARRRFGVTPARHETHAATGDREGLRRGRESLRRELAQLNRRKAMGSWPPRRAFEVFAAVLAAAGALAAGAYAVARSWPRGFVDLLVEVHSAPIAFALAGLAVCALILGPPFLAREAFESGWLRP